MSDCSFNDSIRFSAYIVLYRHAMYGIVQEASTPARLRYESPTPYLEIHTHTYPTSPILGGAPKFPHTFSTHRCDRRRQSSRHQN